MRKIERANPLDIARKCVQVLKACSLHLTYRNLMKYIHTILTSSLVSCPFERALGDDSRTLRRVCTGVFMYLRPKHPKAGKGKGEIELIFDSDIAS